MSDDKEEDMGATACPSVVTMQRPAPKSEVLARTLSQTYSEFEFSVHIPPNSLRRELTSVFPDAPISSLSTPVCVIPTFQRSSLTLLEFGDEQAAEKDRLLERFFEWSERVIGALKSVAPSAWADVTDPASGTARCGAQGSIYSDVDGVVRLLRFDTLDVGGCRVVQHPEWRFAVYPATMFCAADAEAVVRALRMVNGGE